MTFTPTQQALSHILAFWFNQHEGFHAEPYTNAPCPYCAALEDLEAYIDIRLEQILSDPEVRKEITYHVLKYGNDFAKRLRGDDVKEDENKTADAIIDVLKGAITHGR